MDEIAVIGPIADDQATRELLESKEKKLCVKRCPYGLITVKGEFSVHLNIEQRKLVQTSSGSHSMIKEVALS